MCLHMRKREFDAIPLEPTIKNEFQLEVVPDVSEEDEETKKGDTDTETEFTEP